MSCLFMTKTHLVPVKSEPQARPGENEVETNYASFDFHFWVLFFRFGNSLLYYIKLGMSV